MLAKTKSLVGSVFVLYVSQLGRLAIYLYVKALEFFYPLRINRIVEQLESVGFKSIGIVLLTGVSVGMTFGVQVGAIYSIFGVESLIGSTTGLALAIEVAPLTTAFLVAGYFGSSTTAELAAMKISEQLDAMEAMGVSLLNYFVKPTVIATVLAMPMLYLYFMLMGFLGAYIVGVEMFDISFGNFYIWLKRYVWVEDIVKGAVKSTVFGLVVALVSCSFGLRASGGARGIGLTTSNSVVSNLLAILVADVFITYFQMKRAGL